MGADTAKIQLDEVNNVNEFKITADVEFNRPYDNAKHDILKAMDSICKLPEDQQRQLAEEMFGVEVVEMLRRIMCNRM